MRWCLVALVVVLAGCASAESPPRAGGSATTSTTPAAPSTGARTGPTLPPYAPPSLDPANATTVLDRCGVQAPGTLRRWPVDGGRLEGMVLGSGPTVAVFLAQTDDIGMCGWAEYAAWVAGQGVRAILWNRCRDGESTCSAHLVGDPVAQTRVVVGWARSTGADRVVLVGASKGGGIALAAAQPLGANAVVDLSGSTDGAGGEFAPIAEAAAATRVPLLLAMSPGDQDEAPMRAAFAASPATTKQFVAMPGGHGWDYVTDDGARVSAFGEKVLRWIRGDYR